MVSGSCPEEEKVNILKMNILMSLNIMNSTPLYNLVPKHAAMFFQVCVLLACLILEIIMN